MATCFLQVAIEEVEHILGQVRAHVLCSPKDVSAVRTMAGGSVANTVRGLSMGFGLTTGIIAACGDDEQGRLFATNMSFSGVRTSRMRMKKGSTGQVNFSSLGTH